MTRSTQLLGFRSSYPPTTKREQPITEVKLRESYGSVPSALLLILKSHSRPASATLSLLQNSFPPYHDPAFPFNLSQANFPLDLSVTALQKALAKPSPGFFPTLLILFDCEKCTAPLCWRSPSSLLLLHSLMISLNGISAAARPPSEQ